MKKQLLALFISIITVNIHSAQNINSTIDRWIEIDLYWFDKSEMEKSTEEFWNRYNDMFQRVDGWKGVIINIGWMSDYLLEWNGAIDSEIPLPKNQKKWPWFKNEGHFSGNSETRIKLWEQRFADAGHFEVLNYENWTYSELKKLVQLLKTTAETKYNLMDMKVGTFVLGFESIYDGDVSSFSKKHPNSFKNNAPNLPAILSSDSNRYGAFLQGIPSGTPFTEFFGKQWGSLSKALGLDVIILRDSFLGTMVYSRRGPYGKTAPGSYSMVTDWSNATADLVKQTKISNPHALVIGYSNAASAVADWRVNCFDLETIAKQGYLDGWIDQTWAGAWNEVGHRPKGFWNYPFLGWTYQLTNLLIHAAILAESDVRHYFLTETFDAWESWNIIHNAKERLRWSMWAYSHAAVKTPQGLKMPAGNYISWGNQGKKLLSEEDVEFLTKNLNEAFEDARNTTDVFGPTMVYCRNAMEWQSKNSPSETIKEWIDDQTGTIIKWQIPVLSVTRTEYLSDVKSDMFIFQTPNHLSKEEKENIAGMIINGQPCAIFGSPAGGVDPYLAELIGVSSFDTSIQFVRYMGSMNYQTDGINSSLPNTFPLFQPFTKNIFKKELEVIYSVNNSPCLGINQENGKQLIFWDPPEFWINLGERLNYGRSLDEIIGSPVPFVLTSRAINSLLKNNKLLSVKENVSCYNTISLGMWQLSDGTLKLLAGNLEEGINHTSDQTVKTIVNLPDNYANNKIISFTEQWSGEKIISYDQKLRIFLGQAQSKLFIINDN